MELSRNGSVRIPVPALYILGTILIGGCGDADPPPADFRDLGTQQRPLLPTSSVWHDPTINKGASEWSKFTEPQLSALDEKPKPKEAAAGETTSGLEHAGVEKSVREAIAEFNKAVASNAPLEERLDFFVESQRPAIKQISEGVGVFRAKLSELRDVVKVGSPDGSETLNRIIGVMKSPDADPLELASLTVESETAATGKMALPEGLPPPPSGLDVVRFKLEGEYWFIELSGVEQASAMLPMLQAALPQFDALIGGIRSGQVQPDALLAQLKVLEGTFRPKPADAEGGKSGTENAQPPDNKP